MNNTDQIRELLKATEMAIDGVLEWAKYPDAVAKNCTAALDTLNQILALLPCKTCNGTGQALHEVEGTPSAIPVFITLPCPDCTPCQTCGGSGVYTIIHNLTGEHLSDAKCPDCTTCQTCQGTKRIPCKTCNDSGIATECHKTNPDLDVIVPCPDCT